MSAARLSEGPRRIAQVQFSPGERKGARVTPAERQGLGEGRLIGPLGVPYTPPPPQPHPKAVSATAAKANLAERGREGGREGRENFFFYGGLIQTHGCNCPLILLLSLPYHNRLGALATLAKGNDSDLFKLGSMPARGKLERKHFILMGQNC